jgi:hypothetical protein
MADYLPPTAILTIFNPNDFPTINTSITASPVATLTAQTNAVTVSATAQESLLSAITRLPTTGYNTIINGTLNAGAVGTTFTLPFTLFSGYIYKLTGILAMNQTVPAGGGTIVGIPSILVTNNATGTTNSFSYQKVGTSAQGFPSIPISFQYEGNDAQTTLTIRFPSNATGSYLNSPNSFQFTGSLSLFGIKLL